MYDHTTVQGTTFHAWSTVPRARQRHGFVVSVLGSESDNPGSGPGRGKALTLPLRRAGKKKRAPLLGLAKSIYYKKLNYAGILIGSHVRSIGEHTHTQRHHQPHSAFFYHIKQINSMLSWVCSVIDHRKRQMW